MGLGERDEEDMEDQYFSSIAHTENILSLTAVIKKECMSMKSTDLSETVDIKILAT